jgi:hypothetical protein
LTVIGRIGRPSTDAVGTADPVGGTQGDGDGSTEGARSAAVRLGSEQGNGTDDIGGPELLAAAFGAASGAALGIAMPSDPIVSVGSPGGGGINTPMSATGGRRRIMLNPVEHAGSPGAVVEGQFWHTAAEIVGSQYHIGRMVLVPWITSVTAELAYRRY